MSNVSNENNMTHGLIGPLFHLVKILRYITKQYNLRSVIMQGSNLNISLLHILDTEYCSSMYLLYLISNRRNLAVVDGGILF